MGALSKELPLELNTFKSILHELIFLDYLHGEDLARLIPFLDEIDLSV